MGRRRTNAQSNAQSFETQGGSHIRYMRLFADMIYSPAFMNLSSSAKVAYMVLKMQWKGDSFSGSTVTCPYSEFNRFGLANKTIGKAIKELTNAGFIEVDKGTRQTAKNDYLKRQRNIYRFIDKWKNTS